MMKTFLDGSISTDQGYKIWIKKTKPNTWNITHLNMLDPTPIKTQTVTDAELIKLILNVKNFTKIKLEPEIASLDPQIAALLIAQELEETSS